MTRLRVVHPDGREITQTVWYIFRNGHDQCKKISRDADWIDVDEFEEAVAFLEGHWKAVFWPRESEPTQIMQPLPTEGAVYWWHRLHGIDCSDTERGKNVIIGVIDEALAHQSNQSCICHVENHGNKPHGLIRPSNRAWEPESDHSEAVVSLIASVSTDSRGTQGMAPGAEVHFCSAGEDSSERLNIGRVVRCIEYLVDKIGCHLISVSAGARDEETPAIENAVRKAWEKGCLCLFAAGNEPNTPKYPAIYEKCLSVTAVGVTGFAPTETYEHTHEMYSTEKIGDGLYYLWYDGARGNGTDFAGAGSNVIWSSRAKAAEAVNGTSFACPITVGAAAAVLSNHSDMLASNPSPERSEEMHKTLTESCRFTKDPRLEVNYGIINVQQRSLGQ